jgi:hypothetical protein
MYIHPCDIYECIYIYIYMNVTCVFSTADPKYNKQTNELTVNYIRSLACTAEILGALAVLISII